MLNPDSFLCRSLRAHPHGAAVTRILAAAVHAVAPDEAVRRHVRRDGTRLTVGRQVYDLAAFERVFLLSIGKAGLGMASALNGILAERLTGGLIVTKHASEPHSGLLTIMESGHPVPDERSLLAGQRVLEFASGLGERDLLFCLISGGGSALVTSPVPGVTLADLQVLTSALLACGAPIDEINTLRRHLDQVKGGGLARAAEPAHIVSLIISDVVNSPLEAIASGPTAPDPSTKEAALSVIEKYALREKVPARIPKALETAPETPKTSDPLFARVQNLVAASNVLAAKSAVRQAEAEGFHSYLLGTDFQGEAREVALELVNTLLRAAQSVDPVSRPACIVAGGETTVTLRQGEDAAFHAEGKGGRNTELALAVSMGLAGLPDVMLVSLATDGEDGPTDAAGAVVTGETLENARALSMDPSDFLQRHDSYSFFAALGDLLKPGPTGTNVNDLTFLFAF